MLFTPPPGAWACALSMAMRSNPCSWEMAPLVLSVHALSIACCGGEQANTASSGYINRGTPFAKGEVLRSLLSQGVAAVGSAEAGHLVAVDARFSGPDGGIVTRVDGMEHGMVVDLAGRRFQDETAIKGPTRYSTWGRLVAELPERRAALILDAAGFRKIPAFALPPLAGSLPPGIGFPVGHWIRSSEAIGEGIRPRCTSRRFSLFRCVRGSPSPASASKSMRRRGW